MSDPNYPRYLTNEEIKSIVNKIPYQPYGSANKITIMSARESYMKNIQIERVRKCSIVDNILDKKDRMRHSATLCDQADRFLNWLQADLENQNIAEFMSQNDILWVSWS